MKKQSRKSKSVKPLMLNRNHVRRAVKLGAKLAVAGFKGLRAGARISKRVLVSSHKLMHKHIHAVRKHVHGAVKLAARVALKPIHLARR